MGLQTLLSAHPSCPEMVLQPQAGVSHLLHTQAQSALTTTPAHQAGTAIATQSPRRHQSNLVYRLHVRPVERRAQRAFAQRAGRLQP